MAGKNNVADQARTFPNLIEPFMLTIRNTDNTSNVKLVWWYIATLDEDSEAGNLNGEAEFTAELFPSEEVSQKSTFEDDRQVLLKALKLVGNS